MHKVYNMVSIPHKLREMLVWNLPPNPF